MNILFCDDEPEILEIYNIEFDYHAPEHTYFNTCAPEDALEICKNHKIDILFTDSKMPTMSGLELLRELKVTGTLPRKVYIISGYVSDIERGDEVFDYVEEIFTKPPNFEELINTLKKVAV